MAKPQNTEQRNMILKTAFKLFKDNGYNETTTRQIAQECNIDRGLLHYYYNKKGDILYNIYSTYLNTIKDFIYSKFEEQQPEIKIALLTRLFFETIFVKEEFLGILKSILEDHHLRSYKIQLTTSVFHEIIGSDSKSESTVKISVTSAVAAEAELLLGIINGALPSEKSVIEEQIIKIEFDCLNYNSNDITYFLSKSKELIESLDLNSFFDFVKQKIIWI